ncbi:MAG: phosphatase [Tannerellaceae bacterium]
MKEIHDNLYIGNQEDYENIVRHQDGWFVIHACKEPYHRNALGYTSKAAPKDHPEYLIAYRDDQLILNLIDAPSSEYIPKFIIDEAIKAISQNIQQKKVLVHCNQGMSRSAVIGLLYLKKVHALDGDFYDVEKEYQQIYPWYNPGNGMRIFAAQNWNAY